MFSPFLFLKFIFLIILNDPYRPHLTGFEIRYGH